MAVTVTSFGYLHGPTPAAHIVLDLRHHFRDPHINPALRELTADDAAVRAAVLDTPGIRPLVIRTAAVVGAYQAGPTPGPVSVAVGCAGGRHRAPTVAAALARLLCIRGLEVTVTHRDLHRPVINR